MSEGTKQAFSKDSERSAKVLKAIGERARAVEENALRSHIALAAAAKAVIASSGDKPEAFLEHLEAGFESPDFGFNNCQQYIEQASADLRAGDKKGATAQIVAYFTCLRRPLKIEPI
jgi:hypothetical protein